MKWERMGPGSFKANSYKGNIEEQGINDPGLEKDAGQRIDKTTEKEIKL